ncbi:MAG TPA: chemotaxis protein CheW [Myxococcota bacterium]|nr:chemotaxis protein CheW [Myxococcota bacterium]
MSDTSTPSSRGVAAGAATWESLARSARSESAATAAGPSRWRQLLTFRLGEDPYAVPIERVREIVRLPTITPMPRVPACVRGVISLRGEMVEVIDLRRRLGMSEIAPSRTSRVVVLHDDGRATSGLLVDGVNDVMRVPEEAISETTASEEAHVCGLCERGNGFVSLLDVDRVLDLDGER